MNQEYFTRGDGVGDPPLPKKKLGGNSTTQALQRSGLSCINVVVTLYLLCKNPN